MEWIDKTVLVTGAGGFIGSHLVEMLVHQGAQVRAFVRYNSRGDGGLLRLLSLETLSSIEIIPGDLRDQDAVKRAMEGCQIVFHLGAMISIPYSYFHPVEVAQVNFLGTLNVLMASREANIDRLIHTSTSEVYGTAIQVPISESHALQGQSPYSASKIGADKLAESFHNSYDLPVVTIRPFNTYGPRQSARAVIPTIITQVLDEKSLKLGNLETTRDFTYVTDTVNGFLKAAEASNVEGKTFNLGVGQEISIGALAEKIVSLCKRSVKIEQDEVRLRPEKSEVMRLLSDNSLAHQELGWEPRISLDDGLLQTIEWISHNIDKYDIGKYEF